MDIHVIVFANTFSSILTFQRKTELTEIITATTVGIFCNKGLIFNYVVSDSFLNKIRLL